MKTGGSGLANYLLNHRGYDSVNSAIRSLLNTFTDVYTLTKNDWGAFLTKYISRTAGSPTSQALYFEQKNCFYKMENLN